MNVMDVVIGALVVGIPLAILVARAAFAWWLFRTQHRTPQATGGWDAAQRTPVGEGR